jgi:hypothetical protein
MAPAPPKRRAANRAARPQVRNGLAGFRERLFRLRRSLGFLPPGERRHGPGLRLLLRHGGADHQ